jgi:predicted alpha/beta hydrolase family esterase
MKNVLLIHGFNGIPKIFEYFKMVLESKGYNAIMPNFPVREKITIDGYFSVLDMYKEYFNNDLVVIAHSIGNPMFIKYISKNKYNIGEYISLAGFSKYFYNEGKDILNEKIKISVLNKTELDDVISLVSKRYSIFSKDDHIVPYDILKSFCNEISSIPILIDGIGHMGNRSGLEELPIVIDIVLNDLIIQDGVINYGSKKI